MNSFLAWLRQGTTQTGLQAIGLSTIGFVTGAVPLAGLIPAVVVGLVGLIWPEGNAVQAHVTTLVNDALQVAAASSPQVASALGVGAAAPAVAAAPKA